MVLSEAEKQQLVALAAGLRAEFGATDVLLYGSAARGELEVGSDIDLLVVLPELDWEIEKRVIDRCFELELRLGRVVPAACFSKDELTGTPLRVSPFVLNARKDGVAL